MTESDKINQIVARNRASSALSASTIEMPRVLILGLYYPPANFSAARRLEGWARHLPSFGYEPLVLTRYYDPEERNGLDFYASSRATRTLRESWVQENGVVYTKFKSSLWSKLPLPGKLRGLGHFAWPDPDHAGWYRQCIRYLKTSDFKPDIIIGSHSPVGVFRVARKLSEWFNVPWIADFRDLWLPDQNQGFSNSLKLALQRRHLRSAAGITVVTDHTVERMRKQLAPFEKPIRAIYAGAEPLGRVAPDSNDREAVEEFERIQSRYPIVLTYAGTLYSEQQIETYLEIIARFNESGRGPCAFVLFGRHDPAQYKQWPFVQVLGPVKYQTSLYLQGKSNARFYPTWPRSYSVFPGKIFELIMLRRPVLVAFTPSLDFELLCRKFETVLVIKNQEEFLEALDKLTKENLDHPQGVSEIATKKYWARELARFMDEIREHNLKSRQQRASVFE